MMNHTDVRAIVDEYLRGTLDRARTTAFEAHLTACESCRRELDGVRDLLDRSAELPRSIEPPQDLWPRIDRRLSSGSAPSVPAVRARWPFRNASALAAAASVLVVVTLAGTLLFVRTPNTHTEVPFAAHVEFIKTEKHYVAASAELEADFVLARKDLSNETVALIERNLAVIDEAIQEIRSVLAEEPNNREVMSMLASIYQKKLSLLRDVSDLTAEL